MNRLEHVDNYINYIFNDNYPSFIIKSEVIDIKKEYLEVKVNVINSFDENIRTDFKLRFDDTNFHIKDENENWKLLSMVSNFDSVLFKILFFKMFFNNNKEI